MSQWIRDNRRHAIYARDAWTCCYCGEVVSDQELTLDHVRARHNGGGNETANLVTACKSCNSSKQDRALAAFARTFDIPDDVLKRVRNARARSIARYYGITRPAADAAA